MRSTGGSSGPPALVYRTGAVLLPCVEEVCSPTRRVGLVECPGEAVVLELRVDGLRVLAARREVVVERVLHGLRAVCSGEEGSHLGIEPEGRADLIGEPSPDDLAAPLPSGDRRSRREWPRELRTALAGCPLRLHEAYAVELRGNALRQQVLAARRADAQATGEVGELVLEPVPTQQLGTCQAVRQIRALLFGHEVQLYHASTGTPHPQVRAPHGRGTPARQVLVGDGGLLWRTQLHEAVPTRVPSLGT